TRSLRDWSSDVCSSDLDLIRDRADDIGAGQHPHTAGDGVGETFAESFPQFGYPLADVRIGGVAGSAHGAKGRRPRAAARAQRLDLGTAERGPVLDRIRADRRQPRIREI